MKILFVSSSSGSRGGGELYLIFLAKYLKKAGHQVLLWCSDHPRMDELVNLFKNYGQVYRSVYKNTYDYPFRSLHHIFPAKIKSLEGFISKEKPDIIHLNKQNLEDGLDLIYTLDKLKLPYVGTIHITQTQHSLGAKSGGLRDYVARKFLKKSKCLQWFTVAPARQQNLLNFVAIPTQVILNGVDLHDDYEKELLNDKKRTELKLSSYTLVVISVGRLEYQKNPLLFIQWAANCLKINPDIQFYWIGDGSLRHVFEDTVQNKKLHQHIKCLGWQSDVNPYYAMADIYFHTASFEGLPFSLLEAMSWGLPSVVTSQLFSDLKMPQEALLHDHQPNWETYILNRENRIKLGKDSKNLINKEYSVQNMVDSYIKGYKNILHV